MARTPVKLKMTTPTKMLREKPAYKYVKLEMEVYEKLLILAKTGGTTIAKIIAVSTGALNNSNPVGINLNSKMPFGMYRGQIVEDVIRTDLSYGIWLRDKCHNAHNFNQEIFLLVDELEANLR